MTQKTTKSKKEKIKNFKELTLNDSIDLTEKIQSKAYELYEKRGCVHGCDCDDWYEAEKIVRIEMEVD